MIGVRNASRSWSLRWRHRSPIQLTNGGITAGTAAHFEGGNQSRSSFCFPEVFFHFRVIEPYPVTTGCILAMGYCKVRTTSSVRTAVRIRRI